MEWVVEREGGVTGVKWDDAGQDRGGENGKDSGVKRLYGWVLKDVEEAVRL